MCNQHFIFNSPMDSNPVASLHHITSYHITSYHITSHHITSYHIISYHITSHHITSHRRIIVGGFSQGAAMAAITSYQYERQLAGVCCLSGYLPFRGDFGTVFQSPSQSHSHSQSPSQSQSHSQSHPLQSQAH